MEAASEHRTTELVRVVPSAPQVGVIKELSLQTTTEETVPTESTTEENDSLTFAGLGLSEITLRALDRAGFKVPSPIQAGLIPAALAGRDCLGNAPTGTGKTAAFLLPILGELDERERPPFPP